MVFLGCVHYVYCITCECESGIFCEWTWSMGQLWLWLCSVLATFGCGCILNKPTDALTVHVYYCVGVSIDLSCLGQCLLALHWYVGIENPANGVVILMPEKKSNVWECMVKEPFEYASIHWNGILPSIHPHPTQPPLTHVPTHIYWHNTQLCVFFTKTEKLGYKKQQQNKN